MRAFYYRGLFIEGFKLQGNSLEGFQLQGNSKKCNHLSNFDIKNDRFINNLDRKMIEFFLRTLESEIYTRVYLYDEVKQVSIRITPKLFIISTKQ